MSETETNDVTAKGTSGFAWFMERLSAKGMNQRKLASMLDMDPAAVSLLFRGKRRCTIDEAEAIASAIGAAVDEVIIHLRAVKADADARSGAMLPPGQKFVI